MHTINIELLFPPKDALLVKKFVLKNKAASLVLPKLKCV